MEIIEVEALDYEKQIVSPISVFNSVEFAELNKEKVERIHYLLFKDSKVRLGIILGVIKNVVFSPFSAPFGGFSFVQSDVRASAILNAVELMEKWVADKQYISIQLVLPPQWYAPDFYGRLINSLFVRRFQIQQLDVNHQFFVPPDFEMNYNSMLHRNARKNLNNSLNNDLSCHVLDIKEAYRAYEVIAINRRQKNKPLRMSFEKVMETSQIIPSQFFVVQKDEIDIAGAIVFQLSSTVVQVIYWGDNPAFSELRAMNFLSFKVFQYYANLGFEVVDIGISTENSIPNFGLCEFKESIGCSVSLKYTFSKNI
jgi:hypothetical protein